MNKSLSIPEWHELAKSGNAPPVRIILNGYSMHPLIRYKRDHVTIVAYEEEPVIGDIVLFFEPDTGRYVVHRIWEMEDGKIRTWGDYCLGPDRWIPYSAVWGKVILIERGKKKIIPNPQKGIIWAKIWHQEVRAKQLYERYKTGIKSRVSKLIKHFMRGNR